MGRSPWSLKESDATEVTEQQQQPRVQEGLDLTL